MTFHTQRRSGVPMGSHSATASRRATVVPLALLVAMATLVLAACSDDDATGDAAGPQLSAEAQRGLEVAREQGCTACHSTDGGDAVGPSWQGLHGSTVQLEDGSEVVADDDYLTRSIEEPNAQIREGFRGIMPERSLEPDQIEAILAYLRAIGSAA